MLVLMQVGSTPEDAERVRQVAQGLGYRAAPLSHRDRVLIRVAGYAEPPDPALFEHLSGVSKVLTAMRPFPLAEGEAGCVRVGGLEIGPGGLTLIAGPCVVESEEQLLPLARALREAGADMLRGGAYKPRSSPYDFQGLGEDGLRLLAQARNETGLAVVTEAVDEASLALVERYADVIQIGARNMHNQALLKKAGRSQLAVFLKRGFSATLEEFLLAAEYVVSQGNANVMLCERGIRTFSNHSRFTLDLSIVPQIRKVSHLPIFVDPSHASGIRESVAPLARGAVAVGAHGVMIEVHPDPLHALCDGHQSLTPAEFASLASELRAMSPATAQQRETVS